jgi:trk system potassium uptake protein TrkH
VMSGVWSFLSAYVFIFVIFWLILMATGLDPVTAFTALAACLSNAGPGLGSVVANYGTTNDFARWLLSIAMMFGRLEVFTVLVLLSPAFWRR